MERTALLKADYLDILFDRRNKLYGGYELRKNYPERVKKALLFVVVLCSVACGYQLFANSRAVKTTTTTVLPPPTTLASIDNAPVPPPVELPKVQEPPAAAATAANPVMKIVPDDAPIDIKPKTTDDLNGKTIGAVDNPGDPGGTQPDLGGEHGHGDQVQTQPVEQVVTQAPMAWVEQMPEFAGDITAYLQNNLHYPEAAREAEIGGRVIIKFVVNEDGAISGAEVVRGIGGGCDEEALRVVNKMPHWKPGKNNGRPVKVYFTLPISFLLN